MEELVVLLRELTLRLKNERKLKKGSYLSATEVAAFTIRSIPSSQLEPAVSHIDEGSAEFKVVFDLLTSCTGRILSTEIDSRGWSTCINQPTSFWKTFLMLFFQNTSKTWSFVKRLPKTPSLSNALKNWKYKAIFWTWGFVRSWFLQEVLWGSIVRFWSEEPLRGEWYTQWRSRKFCGDQKSFVKKMVAAPLEFPSLLVFGNLFVFVQRIVSKDGERSFVPVD